MIGKRIQQATIEEWTEAGGQEAKTIQLIFEDGTSLQLSQQEHREGDLSSYEMLPYLEVCFTQNK